MNDLSTRPLEELSVESGTRPKAPKFTGVTDQKRLPGRHLAAIHRMYLADVTRIGRLLDHIEAGNAKPGALTEALSSMDFAQNVRQFGSLCGQECHVLTMHHNIEEYSIFPELAQRGNDELRAVVERLMLEHKVVHELLVRLDRAARALMSEVNQAKFDEARTLFRQLDNVIRSHFSYEETELSEALGVLGVQV